MALSFEQFSGDGSNRQYPINFGYLSRDHISVSVDGVAVPFTFLTSGLIQTVTAPAAGTVVEVRRTTPREEPLTDFVDGSTLTESDLDTATLQTFYLAQEAYDIAGGTLGIQSDGSYSANNRRIGNVATPVSAQDAVTKLWAETAMASQLTQAVAAKDGSVSAKAAAEAARDTAGTHRTAAESAKTAAEAARDVTTAARDVTTSARDTVNTDKGIVAADKAVVLSYRNEAQGFRDTAEAHKNAAAASAEAAALWDPSSYDTRAVADTKYPKLIGPNAFNTRPTFASKVPWDSGNLSPGEDVLAVTFYENAGSGVGYIEFDVPSDVKSLIFRAKNFRPVVDATGGYVGFQFRYGSTWSTSGYQWGQSYWNGSASPGGWGSGTSGYTNSILVAAAQMSNLATASRLTVEITPGDTGFLPELSSFWVNGTAGAMTAGYGPTAARITGVRWMFSNSNTRRLDAVLSGLRG